MLDLLGTLPDTELTLTHFDDGRATGRGAKTGNSFLEI